jgi:hypothetical protein
MTTYFLSIGQLLLWLLDLCVCFVDQVSLRLMASCGLQLDEDDDDDDGGEEN